MDLASYIRKVADHPKPGIMFRDVTTLFRVPEAFEYAVRSLSERYSTIKFDAVVGIEARGFVIGAPLALALGVGFVLVRKPGKLPDVTVGRDYQLEYGVDRIEIHKDSIQDGQNILVVDDLLATGGTAAATISLLRDLGATVDHAAFLIDLPDLGGSDVLRRNLVLPYSLMEFSGH